MQKSRTHIKFLTPLKPSADKSMKLQGSSKNRPRNINVLFSQGGS